MTTARLRKYIGVKVADGIVVGAHMIDRTTVEFDVLIDGNVEQHQISLIAPAT